MKKPIHILIIPSWYPAKAGDIQGSFFREQALALSKKGHKVGVIAPSMYSLKDWKSIAFKPHSVQFENDKGVLTYRQQRVNYTPRLKGITRARRVRIGTRLVDKYVIDNGVPDIVHVHSLINAGFIAYKVKQKYGIPYVVTEHSSAFARELVDKKTIKQLIPVVKSSAKNIAVSNEFKNLLEDTFKNSKWEYIPNIVSDEFLEYKFQADNNFEAFTFSNICLMSPNKRVDLIILAFAKAFKGNPNIKLKLGGDGPVRSSLEKLVKREGVSEQVTFLGALERGQVKEEVAKSDAFVLSSEYETFGVVIIEALALGKPVIATRCGGPESIVVPEVGYLVDRNSVESLAQGMIDLYNHREKYSAEAIREYCRCHFSEAAVVDKLTHIYSNVLDKSIHDSQ